MPGEQATAHVIASNAFGRQRAALEGMLRHLRPPILVAWMNPACFLVEQALNIIPYVILDSGCTRATGSQYVVDVVREGPKTAGVKLSSMVAGVRQNLAREFRTSGCAISLSHKDWKALGNGRYARSCYPEASRLSP